MKKINLFLALLLVLTLLCSGASAAMVEYRGQPEFFAFLPGSGYSSSDMFTNFKDCLPGDTLTQEITVSNISLKNVRIYMKAEPVAEADRDFLNQLHMTVDCADANIFDAAPSQTAQLTDYVYLGSFKNKGQTTLTVNLTIPAEMGNEYMGTIGTVPWTFMVKEIEDELTPHTGDWYQMGTWIAVCAVLLAAIVILLLVHKKRRTQEQ